MLRFIYIPAKTTSESAPWSQTAITPGRSESIGHFINTVILRNRVYHRCTLREFLTQVRDTTLAAQANQHLPFEHLVRILERKRKISRMSLFQVMFIYHNMAPQTLDVTRSIFSPADNICSRIDSGITLTSCELILLLKETSRGLVGSLTFKRDTFDSKRARDLRRSFFRILETLMKKPEYSVGWVCARARESKH